MLMIALWYVVIAFFTYAFFAPTTQEMLDELNAANNTDLTLIESRRLGAIASILWPVVAVFTVISLFRR